MQKIECFTSITFSYLAKARVLAWSLKRFHPDWNFTVLITDVCPEGFEFDLKNEVFDSVVWVEDLNIPNWRSWLFKHSVVEICTAVKGPLLLELALKTKGKIIYLDPDIAVLNPLDDLVTLLNNYDIIITPHQLEQEDDSQAIIDNEIGSLKYGIYNLGFIAINGEGEGLKFAQWWNDRLLKYCFDDIPNGLFVDQKWCNHIPSFFDNVKILRHPGYNVASWNISHRKISITQTGDLEVNDLPLFFYHFTKLGPVGDAMTERYAKDNTHVYELWTWYKRKVVEFTDKKIPDNYWFYGRFENGKKISNQIRNLYKSRMDLQAYFKNPFGSESPEKEVTFYKWLEAEKHLQ